MRIRLSFIFLILLIGFVPAANTQSNATLQETQDWISENFGWNFPTNFLDPKCPHETRSNTNLKWDGCRVSWSLVHNGLNCTRNSEVIAFALDLKDLDPEHVALKDYPTRLELYVANKAAVITQQVFVRNFGERQSIEPKENVNKAFIYADDDSFWYRMQSAISHAIEVCGGKAAKPEPF